MSAIDDPDVRRAYLSHACARSAQTARALLPAELFDSTALDRILARVVGASLAALGDDQLAAVADLTEREFTSGRLWALGQWR